VTEIPALLLVAHGSPDPDWRRPLEVLQRRLASVLGETRVGLAYLSQAPTVDAGVEALAAAGATHLRVVAALLSPGGRHIKVDLPATVEATRTRFPALRIELVSGALGEHPAVVAALAEASLEALTR